jgi:hypothetical protein
MVKATAVGNANMFIYSSSELMINKITQKVNPG